jgi:hypothetical protein
VQPIAHPSARIAANEPAQRQVCTLKPGPGAYAAAALVDVASSRGCWVLSALGSARRK